MTRTNKSKPFLSRMGTQFLFKYPDIIPTYRKAAAAISARRCVYLNANNYVVQANADSPNFFGIPFSPIDIGVGEDIWISNRGPARAISQSTLYALLPVKVAESGYVTHGVIIQDQNKAMKAASAGETGEVADSNPAGTSLLGDSNSADEHDYLVAFVKETTTGTLKAVYCKLTGTTEVAMLDLEDDGVVLCDYVYGALLLTDPRDFTSAATGHGTVLVKDAGGTLITFDATTVPDPGMVPVIAAADRRKSFNRKVKLTTSAAATDNIFIIGYDNEENVQYELITYAASLPLEFQSEYNWSRIEFIAAGLFADARTITIDGIQSNVFEPCLTNEAGNFTFTGATQAQQKVEIHSDINTGQDLTGSKVVVFGADSATIRYDEIALTGTTVATSTNNYTVVYGAYISEGTPAGAIVVQKEDDTDLFEFDAATHNSAGIFVNYKGSVGTGAFSKIEIPGCNARPVFTLSNSAATDAFLIVGEDVDGTAQREIGVFVTGVFESIYTWSRITYIAGVTCAAAEYLKVSFEEEDDASSFIGINLQAATAQATEVELFLGAMPWQKIYGKGGGQEILQRIIGPGGYHDVDSLGTAARTANFPDVSGTIPIMTSAGLIQDYDGNTKQTSKFICGGKTETDEIHLTLSGGAVLSESAEITHTAWAVGDWAGGNATRGFWDMDLKAEIVTVALPIPELACDTGVAADLRLGFRLDATNADDVIDYAIYQHDGTLLIDEVNQSIGGAAEATYWINLGALAWSKGDQLIVSFGVFATAADADVDVKVYWLELEAKVGIDNDTA